MSKIEMGNIMIQELNILLAYPRGFCAGVERAIDMVEAALAAYGPPIYVRHSIVHNPMVVDDLTDRGVVFVESLENVPRGARVLFSAHGIPPSVREEARQKGFKTLDATCPLVLKVHREVETNGAQGRHTLIIGDPNHVEIIGIKGHAGKGQYTIIRTHEDAENLTIDPESDYAVVTQTTLSVDDTSRILEILRRRIPGLHEPSVEDICYATTNRQMAVKAIAQQSDVVIVVGGKASANAGKLVSVAKKAGCPRSFLVERPEAFDLKLLKGCTTLGLTSAASTPEHAVSMLISKLKHRFAVHVKPVHTMDEKVSFRSLPIERLA
ncbi:MAG: 4-hydroxy-3-methylbut-2-enyl diphosphate reductase [Geminicoccaceae bacterium]